MILAAAMTLIDTAGTSGSAGRPWAFAGFIAIIALLLALDLGVLHRHAREISMRAAIGWSVLWMSIGVSFAGLVFLAYDHQWLGLGGSSTPIFSPPDAVAAGAPIITHGVVGGHEAARQYLAGYVVEKSLAMDNIFVIAIIFSSFAVPARLQHRVLFWGIVGALLMRGVMIAIGGELILRHQWILIVFGLILLVTAAKLALSPGASDIANGRTMRWVKKVVRVVPFFDGARFFTRRATAPGGDDGQSGAAVGAGALAATPLFLALVLVEVTDLIFAVDSIPAIFAITPDTFIVFTSNIFAILGLRSLYFCLAALMGKFRFLPSALVVILGFVGVKLMLLAVPPYLDVVGLAASAPIKISTNVSLIVIVATFCVAILASLLLPRAQENRTQ